MRIGSAPRPRPALARLRGVAAAAVLAAVWGGVAVALGLLWFAWDLPRPEAALATTRRPSVVLRATDGALLAAQGDLYGDRIVLADTPPALVAALLAVEDRRFFHHPGLDPVGMFRALVANVMAGEVVQGGSTLTQQLAKNLFLTSERSLRRKVQEALMALWLERRFTKAELLEIYLNRVYLGGGAFGIDAAARLYFGIPARRLAVWQSAMLAGLPRAPSRLNPRAAPDLALARTAEVLEAMAATGALTPEAAAREAGRMRLSNPAASSALWFADWALADLATRFPGRADLTLRATLDPRMQAVAETRLAALLAREGPAAGVSEGAVVVLDLGTGAVRAMLGGADRTRSSFNRATQARRQPGSAFKPFVTLAALERGRHPDDTVSDAPLRAGGWAPGNGGWVARGSISLETALAHSVNTAAVRVLAAAGGPDAAIAVVRRLGLEGEQPRDATLALGTGEATLLELTAAYAAFANGGRRVIPFGIAAATSGGAALPVTPPAPVAVLDPGVAATMRRLLEVAVAQGTGRAAAIPGVAVGGKTGTTQGHRDAWFVGWAGGRAIGVWLGNDDGAPMLAPGSGVGVTGGGLPAKLFRAIAEALAAGAP